MRLKIFAFLSAANSKEATFLDIFISYFLKVPVKELYFRAMYGWNYTARNVTPMYENIVAIYPCRSTIFTNIVIVAHTGLGNG